MTISRFPILGLTAALLLSACDTTTLDWDLRQGPGKLSTADAALRATDVRPAPDARGVISYANSQTVVARRGDTVATVATRIGLPAADLARHNALQPTDPLREGEVLALPTRVAAGGIATGTGSIIGSTAAPGTVDVSSIATTALDRVAGSSPAAAPATPTAPTGAAPLTHQVARGETAYSIARIYNISAKALADWNGLGPDLEVREGQRLTIPTSTGAAAAAAPRVVEETVPGEGSPTPVPPSAKAPLPAEVTKPAAQTPKEAPVADLGKDRTAASSSKFIMPADGKIIRAYEKKKNDGIDIAASAGSPVKAAADGTVAAITKDTKGTPIVVIRHDGGLLTVYAGVDGLKVAKGAAVKRGQTIAAVRAGNPAFLHFEVRQGVESINPMNYLQ